MDPLLLFSCKILQFKTLTPNERHLSNTEHLKKAITQGRERFPPIEQNVEQTKC